jgi:hypothetical protein
MPMNFPDMESLETRAGQRGFRKPRENETEEIYREEFADFMKDVYIIESGEIRCKFGWDKWNPIDALKMILKDGE